MKTDEPVYRPIDLHGLHRCEDALKSFLYYSILLDIEDLQVAKRLEIINHCEQIGMQLRNIRITHELLKSKFMEQKERIYKKTNWGGA